MFELSFANALLFISFFITVLYFWNKHAFGYWKRRGVYSPPSQFLIGHLGPVAIGKQSLGVRLMDVYTQTKDHPYVGIQLAVKKTLVINDLDMAKTVLLKDFDHFSSHGIKQNKEVDPLGEHLFNLDGEKWKKMRVKLTPTFTSSKMKFMFDTMLSCSHDMIDFVKGTAETGEISDIKEIIAKFGTDVIGSCAFGIQTNSFKHPDAEFRRVGKDVFEATFLKMVLNTFAFIAPNLVPKFLMKRAMGDIAEFFTRTVEETIAYREKNKIVRNDFLQLLIDMKNADEKSGNHLTIEEIVPQVFVFFVAGFETSSTAATYAFLELAKNKHIQEKAREHIDKAFEECDGKITYETINQLSYLTQIVNESMRMYPPLPFLFRNCTKDYKIAGTETVIEKGTMVVIPILGIQRNSKYYPDPLQFEPDRFSPENVSKRHQYAHLPFGEGPRNCIGSRFGMMQVKLALFTILRSFHVDLVAESSGPVKFDPKAFLLHTEGEMLLKFTPR